MKRAQIGIGLLIVVACSIIVSTASATTYLLTAMLNNGASITSDIAAEITNEFSFEDKNALKSGIKADVLCSFISKVTVSSEGWIDEEILTLEGTAVSLTALLGTSLSCTNDSSCEAPHVWAVHLPWSTGVELWVEGSESGFIILNTLDGAGNPGWYVECTILGIKASDECTAANIPMSAENETGGVLLESSEPFTELAELSLETCTSSGEATGVLEGSALETSASGTLTLSSVN